MKTKKLSNFGLILILTLIIGVFTVTPAMAAGKDIDITKESVAYSKIDIENISLSDKSKSYSITIDKGAIEAAQEKGKIFRVTMDNVTLEMPPESFYTADYKKAVATGKPVKVKLYVKTKQGFDMGRYFTPGINNNFMLIPRNTTISAEIYVAGIKTYDMHQFATLISFIQDYSEDWNNSNSGKKESGVTLAWYDMDRDISTGTPKWVRLSTKLDTKNNIATATNIYSCGIIVPIVCTDLDNSSGNSSSGNGGNSGSSIPDGFWAKSDIEQMQQARIITDYISYDKLNSVITRDEFVCYLVRTLKLSEDTSLAGQFVDVAKDNSYYDEIYTGLKNGLVTGTSANTFSPNAQITRQEMAAFFTRALKLKNISVDNDKTNLIAMKDYKTIAAWAEESCAVVVNKGLISGRSSGSCLVFAPQSNTTWSEAVVMLNRLRNDI